MEQNFLIDGAANAAITILLAHGAGAPMDSASMNAATAALVAVGIRVVRFEFGYMAARRGSRRTQTTAKGRKADPEYLAAIAALGATGPLIIGGKSMGGRVASMVADDLCRGERSPACSASAIPSIRRASLKACARSIWTELKTPTLDLPGNPRRIRNARGGCKLRTLRQHPHSLARRRRSRPETAQDDLRLLGRRPPEDDGRNSEALVSANNEDGLRTASPAIHKPVIGRMLQTGRVAVSPFIVTKSML